MLTYRTSKSECIAKKRKGLKQKNLENIHNRDRLLQEAFKGKTKRVEITEKELSEYSGSPGATVTYGAGKNYRYIIKSGGKFERPFRIEETWIDPRTGRPIDRTNIRPTNFDAQHVHDTRRLIKYAELIQKNPGIIFKIAKKSDRAPSSIINDARKMDITVPELSFILNLGRQINPNKITLNEWKDIREEAIKNETEKREQSKRSHLPKFFERKEKFIKNILNTIEKILFPKTQK